jgi:large subunit ribosomal protein L10
MQENPRPEKAAVVTEVKERLDAADAAILTEYRGLTVQEIATLRRSLRAAGGDYKIYKNTLVRFAAQAQGLDELVPLLVGPTAIAFVEGDAVTVAKALRDFAKTNPNLVVKGGLLGTGILTAKEATALADIPPREVLLARLAGGLAAPLQQFAGLLQALPRNLAYGLSALIEKQGGVPEAAPEPEPEAAAPAPEAEAPAEEAAAEATAAEPEAGAEASAAEAAAEETAAPETASEPTEQSETQQESE